MSDRKIEFGLVGCGSVSKKHILSIERIEDAEIKAICDVDPEIAKAVGEENGFPYYTDYLEMAEREDFDVFSILTPSGHHARAILELVRFGRHFVVEKPLALRIEDADKVIQACDKSGLKIFVVKQNRCNLPVRMLKAAIEAGRFGKIVMGTVRVRWCRRQSYYDEKKWRGTWANDGGVLTNQASHHIDMLSWLLGDVESVMALTTTRLAKIETEDTGVAVLRFTSGALGLIEATTATRPEDLEGSISILGEKGSVEIGGFYMNELKTWKFENPVPDDKVIFEKWGKNPNIWAWNHTEYMKDVVKSIKQNTRGLVEGLEGLKSLDMINAIYKSAETRKMVSLRSRPRFRRLGM
ncbi:oxidoreductase [candidate division WOR-1 bacterium DG_54_3]|uniref:Oxidoreductase n=1 Tax=candidate division WOR-1 bacterium DG_54_3 TaxID=1703775 RepID=A0A0S7XR73_UNCSA|nr:MAG: oxidoreductase [candidate division WOR-1 bacterium DG_54_3]